MGIAFWVGIEALSLNPSCFGDPAANGMIERVQSAIKSLPYVPRWFMDQSTTTSTPRGTFSLQRGHKSHFVGDALRTKFRLPGELLVEVPTPPNNGDAADFVVRLRQHIPI